jgi:hypothetical protein
MTRYGNRPSTGRGAAHGLRAGCHLR